MLALCLLVGIFFSVFTKNIHKMNFVFMKKTKEEAEEGEKKVSIRNLLSFLSQLSTLAFQSHVCFSMSNAKPEGQVICFSPARVHLCVCTTTTTVHVFHYQSFRFISFQVSWFFFRFIIQC